MSITRQNLSVIIVSYKSDHVIENCINSIDGEIEIIRDLTLSDNARSRLNISVNELLTEKEAVKDLL